MVYGTRFSSLGVSPVVVAWPWRKGRVRVGCRVLARRGVAEEVLTAGRQAGRGSASKTERERESAKLWRLVYARCVPLFRGFIAAVGINEGPCFHGGRVAVQISFYYLPRGIYSTTTDRQGVVVVSSMVGVANEQQRERERIDGRGPRLTRFEQRNESTRYRRY